LLVWCSRITTEISNEKITNIEIQYKKLSNLRMISIAEIENASDGSKKKREVVVWG
jgi:hypothetical protein